MHSGRRERARGHVRLGLARPSNGQEATFTPTAPGTPAVASIYNDYLQAIACPSTRQCTALDNFGGEETFNPTSPGAVASATMGNSQYSSNLTDMRVRLSGSAPRSICTARSRLTQNQSPATSPPHDRPDQQPDQHCVPVNDLLRCGRRCATHCRAIRPPAAAGRSPRSAANSLNGVSCSSLSRCVAVGAIGDAYRPCGVTTVCTPGNGNREPPSGLSFRLNAPQAPPRSTQSRFCRRTACSSRA